MIIASVLHLLSGAVIVYLAFQIDLICLVFILLPVLGFASLYISRRKGVFRTIVRRLALATNILWPGISVCVLANFPPGHLYIVIGVICLGLCLPILNVVILHRNATAPD